MNEKELKDLLGNLNKLVPTLLVVGMTSDGDDVVFLVAKGENEREMTINLSLAIATTIGKNKKLQQVLYTAVLSHMHMNPMYAKAMQQTLKQMKLVEHFADASKMMDKTKN